MTIAFSGRVAIVTGAANGLGRSYATELARRGAKVVVNDFGGSRDGTGSSVTPAEQVAEEIRAAGGDAIASGSDVTNYAECKAMVAQAVERWGRLDILINNAGILRDSSFGKLTPANWRAVLDVHLDGSAYCTMAAWNRMKGQGYGRILMTTSVSGIYGNFGQANYGAAKMGVIGLMHTLVIEGAKYDIRVNCISPTAATRMTEDLLSAEMLARLDPKWVTPAALYLVSDDSPDRTVMFAGAGHYSTLEIRESRGVRLAPELRTPEAVAENMKAISGMEGAASYSQGGEHVAKILGPAAPADA